MYSVYINHFKQGSSIIDTETLMFKVPDIGGFPISKPIVKCSESMADNLSFTMDVNSPYYDALLPLKTIIKVVYGDSNGDIIFYGRVTTSRKSTVFNTKSVSCEGVFAYFNDTYYEGKQDKFREKMSLGDYYTKVINNHNTMDPSKTIYKGNIDGIELPSETEKYEPSGWTQTSSLINDLKSKYGGNFKIRYENSVPYLDWYKYYFRDLGDGLRPEVAVGKNILDISSDQKIDNIFTRIIPIGSSGNDGATVYIDGATYTDKNGTAHTHSGKAFGISLMRDLYTDLQLTDEFHNASDYDNAETDYGIIYKTVSFNATTDKNKLFEETKKWVKESYFPISDSFTVKAVDMHIINTDNPRILVGECVDVNYLITRNGNIVQESRKLVCKNAQYDLFNPENDSYTFGIPGDLLEHSKSNENKMKSASGATAGGLRPPPDPDDDDELTWEAILRMIGDRTGDPDYEGGTSSSGAYASFRDNGELSGTVSCYDPEDLKEGQSILDHKELWFTAQIVGKITLPGKTTKWVAVSSDKGIFAYVDVAEVNPVTHWYTHHKGYQYSGSDPGMSSFEDIAKIIEKDSSSTYGGLTNANAFRTNGRLSGAVMLYDPNVTQTPVGHPESIMNAEIVGRFGSTYVALSNEYGIVAYVYTRSQETVSGPSPEPEPNIFTIVHWYMRVKGLTYNNISNFIEDEGGDSYTTEDGSPDSGKTVYLKTRALNAYGSNGEMLIGYDASASSQDAMWRIKLNVPVRYTGDDDLDHVADGFVTAKDFQLVNTSSLKTKLGIFDVVIAGAVQAAQIAADLAILHNLVAGTIIADTTVAAENIYGSSVYSSNYILNRQDSGRTNLKDCFIGCSISSSGGVISLNFVKADGTSYNPDPPVNFNMADTQFYQDAVSASHNTGGKTAYLAISGATLNNGVLPAGESVTINAYYVNSSGTTGRTPSNTAGRPITMTITAASGGSVSPDDIIVDPTSCAAYASDPGGTDITSIAASAIKTAVQNGQYFKFTIQIHGTQIFKSFKVNLT